MGGTRRRDLPSAEDILREGLAQRASEDVAARMLRRREERRDRPRGGRRISDGDPLASHLMEDEHVTEVDLAAEERRAQVATVVAHFVHTVLLADPTARVQEPVLARHVKSWLEAGEEEAALIDEIDAFARQANLVGISSVVPYFVKVHNTRKRAQRSGEEKDARAAEAPDDARWLVTQITQRMDLRILHTSPERAPWKALGMSMDPDRYGSDVGEVPPDVEQHRATVEALLADSTVTHMDEYTSRRRR